MQLFVQRFWSRGGWQLIAMMVTVLALGSCSGASSGATSVTPPPLPTPTPLPSPTATPSGPPTLGAPEAAFVAAYGPIVGHNSDGSDKFWADKAHRIALTVRFSSGKANLVDVLSTDSWTATYTFNYCRAFLPPGASKVHASGQFTIYQSALGPVVLYLAGPDICTVGVGQS